jgi:hypothetical protein
MQLEISDGNWIKVNEGYDAYLDFLHTFVATEQNTVCNNMGCIILKREL